MDPVHAGDALIVIDMQRKYLVEGGAFEVPGADALVERTADFADAVRKLGLPVIWVTRQLRAGVSMGEGTKRDYGSAVDDLFRGPNAELDPRLRAQPDDVRVVKPRQSSFYGTDLEVILRSSGVSRVVLAGVTTNICVQATAQDARARDFTVVVAQDLTASLPTTRGGFDIRATEVQRTTLATIAHAIGSVTTTDLLSPAR